MRAVLLYVEHEGREKLVGKLIPHDRRGGEPIFFHRESGSQWHWLTDCPAPIDAIVIPRLRDEPPLRYLYVYDQERELLWRIGLWTVEASPVGMMGGRLRHFPTRALWSCLSNVGFTVVKGDRHYHDLQGQPVLVEPYIDGDDRELLTDEEAF
jgi:hypothetical protein